MMTNDIEWKMVKLGDVCTMPTKTISSNTFETRFYVGTENMLQNCFGIIDNEISISTVRVREYKKDDILMSNIRPYLKKIWFSDKNAGCSTDVNIFRTNGKCFPKYLFHVLCQDDFFNYVNDNAIGTKMPRGDKRIIPNFFIPLPYKNGAPDLETQKQIAQKLGDMDRLIAAKEKLLAKKRNLKVAAMQKLIKDEEGENWKKVKLGECGIFSKGSGISRSECTSGVIPAVRYGELYTKHNDYIKCFFSFISKDVAKTAHKLNKGDILFTASGETKEDIGKTVAFIDDIEAYAGGDLIILSPFCEYDSKFLGLALNAEYVRKQKAEVAQGDAVVHIRTGAIKGIFVYIPFSSEGTPDINEQRRIASILSDMDSEIAAIEKEITKLQNLKTAMMQKMFCFEDSDSSSE